MPFEPYGTRHTKQRKTTRCGARAHKIQQVYPPSEGKDLWEGQQIVSRPEVHTIQVTEEDSFLILACDGVWDALTCQQAVSYVHRRLLTHRDVQRAAVELIDKVGQIGLASGGAEWGG